MATKEQPGDFDCYANAKPDEPMFVLLARDKLAPIVVNLWIALRCNDPEEFQRIAYDADIVVAKQSTPNPAKIAEALRCADAMTTWKTANPEL